MYIVVYGGFHNVPMRRWRVLPGEMDSGGVSWAPYRRRLREVEKHLCGVEGCTCGGRDAIIETEQGNPIILSDWNLYYDC